MSDTEAAESTPAHRDPATHVLRGVLLAIGAVVALAIAWLGLAYASSPASIRHPQATHYHFRLQLLVNSAAVNFGKAPFQESEAGVCSEDLTSEPIHFHDNLDQFVHIHWNGMTGGLLLKNYGWNLISGPDDTLGYRFDQLPKLTRVPIHGHDLPKPPADAHYYTYTSTITDPTAYRERSWNDFLHQDLHTFFGAKTSTSWLNQLVPSAYAHGDDDKLAALNDVLGNVVVFVQKTPPAPAQIKARFEHLIPLPESTCGG